MNLYVTHFFQRPKENDDWVPLPFITRRINAPGSPYYFGFETFREISSTAINRQLKDGTLKPLSWPIAISPGQALWLTSANEIYIASEKNPIIDQNKLMIDLASNVTVLSNTWLTGHAFRRLLHSDITRTILERGELNYVFGDYLTSKQVPCNGAIYEPAWQNKILSLAKRDIEKAAAAPSGKRQQLRLGRLQEQEHRYRHIEELIVADNLPVHWEMIFKTWRREMMIDVIHLANVHELSLVAVRNSAAQKKLGLEDRKRFGRHFEDWIKCLDEAKTEICAPTEQSSEHLLLRAITHKKLLRERKTERSTLREWKEWILDKPQNKQRVMVCDIGIAHRLKAACSAQAHLIMSFVPYDVPVPVGIAHKKDDSIWRNFLLREIRRVVSSNIENIGKSFDDTKERCKELGMRWVWRN